MYICFATPVQNFSFNRPSADLGFGSKVGERGGQIFCRTFQNTDYHKHRVVQCEIAGWCSVNDSATEQTLTIKSLAYFFYPACGNKTSVVALDDKSVEVLRDTTQQRSATVNTNFKTQANVCFTCLQLLFFFPPVEGHAQDSPEKNWKKIWKMSRSLSPSPGSAESKQDLSYSKSQLCKTKNVNSSEHNQHLHATLNGSFASQYWRAESCLLNVCCFLAWLFTQKRQKRMNLMKRNCQPKANVPARPDV